MKSRGIKDRDKTLEVLEGFISRNYANVSSAQRHHALGYNRAYRIFSHLIKLKLIKRINKDLNLFEHRAAINLEELKSLKLNSHEID